MKKSKKTIALYEAALKIFSRYGFKKATLDDIASQLDMTKGNIYLYTKNKKSLYDETVAYALKKWQKYAIAKVEQEKEAGHNTVAQLSAFAIAGYEYLQQDKHLSVILLENPGIFPLSPTEDKFSLVNEESKAYAKKLLERGVKEKTFAPIDTEEAGEILWAIYVMFIIKTYVKNEQIEMNALFTTGFNILFNGLKA